MRTSNISRTTAVGSAFLLSLLPLDATATPSISIDSVIQRWPWNNKIDITYTISGDGGQDIANFNYCKVVFTATIPGRAEPVVIDGSSDVIAKAENGTWTVTWTNAPAGVKADNCTMVASLYRTTGDYMVVDLDTGAYAFDDLADGDTPTATPAASNARYNTPLYKTDRMVFRRVPRTADAAAAYAGGYPTGHADFSAPTYTGSYTNSVTTWTTDKDYFVGVFEVTVAQAAKLGQSWGSWKSEQTTGGLDPNLCPADKIMWNTLRETNTGNDFFPKLKSKTGLTGFMLPTEVMWEIAARAGATTVYPWGDTMDTTYCHCNYTPLYPITVGSRKSNAWGLFDMIGNVSEYTHDNSGALGDLADRSSAWQRLDSTNVNGNWYWMCRGGYFNMAKTHDSLKASCRVKSAVNWEQRDSKIGFRVSYIPQ